MRQVAIFVIILVLSGCLSKGERNRENLEKVQTGMTTHEVVSVMGDPDTVLALSIDRAKFRYLYDPPFGASDNIYVVFSSFDSVVVYKVAGD
jgi:hypothetical protein